MTNIGKVPIVRVPDWFVMSPLRHGWSHTYDAISGNGKPINTLQDVDDGTVITFRDLHDNPYFTLTRDPDDPTMWIMEECK